jgi:transposase
MFFKTATRPHPQTGAPAIYYRLVENCRNVLGEVRQRSILTVGFMEDVSTEELHRIADGLNERIAGQQALFEDSPKVGQYIDSLYARLVREKRIDRLLDIRSKNATGDWHTVDLNTLQNKDVRELGAEWLCLQTLYRLQVDRYLQDRGWSVKDRDLALAHIVSRTIYPASELKTVRFIQENSSIAEILELDASKITKDHLYRISHRLFAEKEGLEQHLSRKTNELFDLQDKIILYDLTNTYFEGEMRTSHIAKRGRSKEKRSDCPLLVLALVVNVEGFIKYSAIYEGNKADSATLGDMIDKLQLATSEISRKPIVVIDAGIATEANLALIVEKGYDYVCVSRSNLKEYSPVQGTSPVTVFDRKNRRIELVQVQTAESNDSEYYLQVTSPAKALKEESMYRQFMQRYEEGLALIAKGIANKGGVKKYDKVNQRIGRLQQKYPSGHRMYRINLQKNDKDTCTGMTWELVQEASVEKQDSYGVYFLRTSLVGKPQEVIWTIYNCIREIENSFRTLKTDLDLRPIFHKTDDASQAHLHLGMLAYWVVNTVRHQLKACGVTSEWRELVRVMNTQKCVTTTMINDRNEHISIRCCSQPSPKVALVYDTLKLKPAPFVRKKSVVRKMEPEINRKIDLQKDTG